MKTSFIGGGRMVGFGKAASDQETRGFEVLVNWEHAPQPWTCWSSFGPDERREALQSAARASIKPGAVDVKVVRVLLETVADE